MTNLELAEYRRDIHEQESVPHGDVSNATLATVNTPANIKPPIVAVLLCTWNGSRYLEEQLDSIEAQDYQNIDIWVSDDGSKDNTNPILEIYRSSKKGHFSIQYGPQQGFAANFLSLICHPDIQADYYAYADQDDIWQPDKLTSAITKLKSVPAGVPALYCSRTCLIDENGRYIGLSTLFEKPPSFANALVQVIGGGNTMVMNKAARDLMCAAGYKEVASHDWWAYILISGAGGKIIYDSYSTVRYRQHDSNFRGSNRSWPARLLRIWMLMKGRFRDWNSINARALNEARHLLTPENQCIFDKFCIARNRWLIPRLWGIMQSGIYRQTMMGNLGLIVAILLKKL